MQISKNDYQNIAMQMKKTKKMIHSSLRTQDRSIVKEFLKHMNDKDNDLISDEAEKFITDYISNIILNTTRTACRIAHGRNSRDLEKKDIDFAIQIQLVQRKKMSPNSYSPSKEMEEIFSKVREPKQEHIENMEMLEKFQQSKREQNK